MPFPVTIQVQAFGLCLAAEYLTLTYSVKVNSYKNTMYLFHAEAIEILSILHDNFSFHIYEF